MAFDLTLAGKMTMDAKQARGELQGAAKDAQATKTAVGQIGTEAKQTDTDIAALRSEISQYRKQMQGLAADNMAAVRQIDVLQSEVDQLNAKLKGTKGTGNSAAGSMGNLVAQFNDIGVMMAAGQNPLQLALQQGTQVSQVIGPMGAAGAVKALRGAFVSMLNPTSLITIASIAAGAALVKWLSTSKEEARDLDDVLDDVARSIDELHEAAGQLDTENLDELKAKYGAITDAVIDMLEAQRAMARLAAIDDMAEAQEALAKSADDVFSALGRLDQKGRTLRNAYASLAENFGLTRAEADALRASVDAVAAADGPRAQADAYARMRQLLSDAIERSGEMTDEQEELLNNLLSSEDAARRFAAIDMVTGISEAASEAARMADNVIKAVAATQELKSQAQVDMETAKIRLKYADDPVEQARQLGIQRMQREQAPMRERASPIDLVELDAEAISYGDLMAQTAQLDQQRLDALKSTRGDRSGSGSKSAADALAKLIDREQEQLALLRETDPVQQAMIRNREALAGATDEERAAVEALIRTRIEEQEALDGLQAQRDYFADTAYDAIEGLALQGDSLVDVFESVADAIAKAVLQAAFLGQGPLAGMFGGSGSGGLLGSIATALFPSSGGAAIPAKAAGGPIHEAGLLSGPGGGTSDQILMYGSAGEFMMNAKATKKYRHLLELMNAGGLPKFAKGGAIGGTSGSFAPQLNIMPMNNSSVPLDMAVEETTDSRGQRAYQLVLSDAVATGISARGGKAQRTMRSQFGVRKKGIAR